MKPLHGNVRRVTVVVRHRCFLPVSQGCTGTACQSRGNRYEVRMEILNPDTWSWAGVWNLAVREFVDFGFRWLIVVVMLLPVAKAVARFIYGKELRNLRLEVEELKNGAKDRQPVENNFNPTFNPSVNISSPPSVNKDSTTPRSGKKPITEGEPIATNPLFTTYQGETDDEVVIDMRSSHRKWWDRVTGWPDGQPKKRRFIR